MSLIYRFRKISDYSIRELMDDEIWGSTSDFLNDPFEGKIAFDFDYIKNKLVGDSLNKGFVNLILITSDVTRKIEQMNYIASFTRNDFKNELMWAHYANQARGFALAYEEDDLKRINNTMIIKDIDYIYSIKDRTNDILDIIVNYNKNKQILIPQDLANEVNLSKSDSWKYEKEVRIILKRDNDDKHIRIGKLKPIAIYIGKNCSDKDKYVLYSIAYKKNIILHQIDYVLKNNEYILRSRKIENDEIEESLNSFCFQREILLVKKIIKNYEDKKIKDLYEKE